MLRFSMLLTLTAGCVMSCAATAQVASAPQQPDVNVSPCCQSSYTETRTPGWISADLKSRERVDVTPYLYAEVRYIDPKKEEPDYRVEVRNLEDVPEVARCRGQIDSGTYFGRRNEDRVAIEDQFPDPNKSWPKLASRYAIQLNRCVRLQKASKSGDKLRWIIVLGKAKEVQLGGIQTLYDAANPPQ